MQSAYAPAIGWVWIIGGRWKTSPVIVVGVYVLAGGLVVVVVGGVDVVTTGAPTVWHVAHWSAVRPVWSAVEPAVMVKVPGVTSEPFQVGGSGNWLRGMANGGAWQSRQLPL